MSTPDSILDKLRKLHAHAESAATLGNEHEAQAFAAKVQSLLTAYKLSMADLGRESVKRAEEPVNMQFLTWEMLGLPTKKVRVAWVEHLGVMCGKAYYCEFLISRQFGNLGLFVGTDTDREVATFMFVTLARYLHKLAAEEYVKFFYANVVDGHLPAHLRGYKEAFLAGFLRRLQERFDEENRSAAQTGSTALVLVKRDALAKNQQFLRDKGWTKTSKGLSLDAGNRMGREAGRAAANAVSLKPNAVEGAAPARRELNEAMVTRLTRYFELVGADDEDTMKEQARVKFPKATDTEIEKAIKSYFEDAQ